MKLRIISGELKGRFVQFPEKNTHFRPTLERVRESVAEKIKFRLPGSHVADVCAGSGAFGFEMVSRGAVSVEFVEINKYQAETIRKNAQRLCVSEKCRIYNADIRSFTRKCPKKFDIIYYDPPYDHEELHEWVSHLAPLLATDGILLYEYREKCAHVWETLEAGAGLEPYDLREFRNTNVAFLRNRS